MVTYCLVSLRRRLNDTSLSDETIAGTNTMVRYNGSPEHQRCPALWYLQRACRERTFDNVIITPLKSPPRFAKVAYVLSTVVCSKPGGGLACEL